MTKMYGEERRAYLLEQLATAGGPLTGTELAKLANVSRQVIVSDMTLLKARKEPIISTSQGYLYLEDRKERIVSRQIACVHRPEDTASELKIITAAGATVKDVTIEHPVYGELTANVFVSTEQEAEAFIEKIRKANAGYLLELTEGFHLHTLTAPNEAAIERAIVAMREHGFLIEDQES
ncbi:transcription repressor NadR [Planococcus lenghuensis]|uniref:Transcription repressor NadR n=1 Tax=Planococcus lenghuensis TaxID=2213202 RepID=A0A1Q2KXQ7_9BACL|nr:transcription repressor NadR [Planococcus lenghuensis]AQQ52906.1 transcription repressor NadR [Planococcus lenghuensis]